MQRFGAERVRLVLNRYDSRRNDIDEEHVTKAVGVPVTWKVPNDYAAVRKSHNTAVPLALGDSLFSRAVRQMARDACGKSAGPPTKKGLRLFG
jgi:pilus assembly protein CpaE